MYNVKRPRDETFEAIDFRKSFVCGAQIKRKTNESESKRNNVFVWSGDWKAGKKLSAYFAEV